MASAMALIGKVLRDPAVNEILQRVQSTAHATKEHPSLEKYQVHQVRYGMSTVPFMDTISREKLPLRLPSELNPS